MQNNMKNMQLSAKYAKYAIKVLVQYIKSSTWPGVLSSWNSLGSEFGPDRPPFHPRWTSLRMTSVPPPPPEKARQYDSCQKERN